MPEIFVHNDDDSLHPLERNPVVDENLDNVSGRPF